MRTHQYQSKPFKLTVSGKVMAQSLVSVSEIEQESEIIASALSEKLTILGRLKFTVNLIKVIKSELIEVNVNELRDRSEIEL